MAGLVESVKNLFGGGGKDPTGSVKQIIQTKEYAKEYLEKLAASYSDTNTEGDAKFAASLRTIAGNDAFLQDFFDKKHTLTVDPFGNGDPNAAIKATVNLQELVTAAKDFSKDKEEPNPLKHAANQLEQSFKGRTEWRVAAPEPDAKKVNDSNAGMFVAGAAALLPLLIGGFSMEMLLLAAVVFLGMSATGLGTQAAEMLGFKGNAKTEPAVSTLLPVRAPGKEYPVYLEAPEGKSTALDAKGQALKGTKEQGGEMVLGTATIPANQTDTTGLPHQVIATFDTEGKSTGLFLQNEKGVRQQVKRRDGSDFIIVYEGEGREKGKVATIAKWGREGFLGASGTEQWQSLVPQGSAKRFTDIAYWAGKDSVTGKGEHPNGYNIAGATPPAVPTNGEIVAADEKNISVVMSVDRAFPPSPGKFSVATLIGTTYNGNAPVGIYALGQLDATTQKISYDKMFFTVNDGLVEQPKGTFYTVPLEPGIENIEAVPSSDGRSVTIKNPGALKVAMAATLSKAKENYLKIRPAKAEPAPARVIDILDTVVLPDADSPVAKRAQALQDALLAENPDSTQTIGVMHSVFLNGQQVAIFGTVGADSKTFTPITSHLVNKDRSLGAEASQDGATYFVPSFEIDPNGQPKKEGETGNSAYNMYKAYLATQFSTVRAEPIPAPQPSGRVVFFKGNMNILDVTEEGKKLKETLQTLPYSMNTEFLLFRDRQGQLAVFTGKQNGAKFNISSNDKMYIYAKGAGGTEGRVLGLGLDDTAMKTHGLTPPTQISLTRAGELEQGAGNALEVILKLQASAAGADAMRQEAGGPSSGIPSAVKMVKDTAFRSHS